MLREAAFAFIVRVGGAVAALIMNLVVARVLGIKEAGVFFIGYSLLMILSSIARVGSEYGLVKLVSIAKDKNNYRDKVYVFWLSMAVVLGIGSMIGFFLKFSSNYISSTIFNGDVLDVFGWIAVIIPFHGLLFVMSAYFQGIGKVQKAIGIKTIAVPFGVSVVLMLSSMIADVLISAKIALIALFAVIMMVLLSIAIYLVLSKEFRLPTRDCSNRTIRLSDIFSCYGELFVVTVMEMVVLWSAPLIAGALLSAPEAALISVCQRLSMAASFILMAMNAVVAPKFAALHAGGKIAELQHLACSSARISTLVAIPVFVVLIFCSKYVLGVFGDEFVLSSAYFQIMMVGQLFNALTGSVLQLMIMSGNEREVRKILCVSAVANVFGLIVLIYLFKGVGASVAVALTVVFQNAMLVVCARKKLGFWPMPLKKAS